MQALAFEQFERLERAHWWFRGRRAVCLALLDQALARARAAGTPVREALEIGTGPGGFLEDLAARVERVHALEPDPAACRRAAGRGGAHGVRAGGERLPYRDASLDLVCAFDVLEHLEDDAACLREVHRVLRPGGLLLLHVPAHPWLFAENDRVAGHRRRYTRRALEAAVRAAGLERARCTGTNALLFPAIAPAVLALRAAEALGLAGRGHTNLSWPAPGPLGRLLGATFAAERHLLRHVDLPLGHSLALVARRPARSGANPGDPARPEGTACPAPAPGDVAPDGAQRPAA